MISYNSVTFHILENHWCQNIGVMMWMYVYPPTCILGTGEKRPVKELKGSPSLAPCNCLDAEFTPLMILDWSFLCNKITKKKLSKISFKDLPLAWSCFYAGSRTSLISEFKRCFKKTVQHLEICLPTSELKRCVILVLNFLYTFTTHSLCDGLLFWFVVEGSIAQSERICTQIFWL